MCARAQGIQWFAPTIEDDHSAATYGEAGGFCVLSNLAILSYEENYYECFPLLFRLTLDLILSKILCGLRVLLSEIPRSPHKVVVNT